MFFSLIGFVATAVITVLGWMFFFAVISLYFESRKKINKLYLDNVNLKKQLLKTYSDYRPNLKDFSQN